MYEQAEQKYIELIKPVDEWSNISICNSGLSQPLTVSRMHLSRCFSRSLVLGAEVFIHNVSMCAGDIWVDFLSALKCRALFSCQLAVVQKVLFNGLIERSDFDGKLVIVTQSESFEMSIYDECCCAYEIKILHQFKTRKKPKSWCAPNKQPDTAEKMSLGPLSNEIWRGFDWNMNATDQRHWTEPKTESDYNIRPENLVIC